MSSRRWSENALREIGGKPLLPLIDLGYVKDRRARRRADRLTKFLRSKHTSELAYGGRLLCHPAPTKLAGMLIAFPGIRAVKTYAYCTHSWLDADSSDVRFILR